MSVMVGAPRQKERTNFQESYPQYPKRESEEAYVQHVASSPHAANLRVPSRAEVLLTPACSSHLENKVSLNSLSFNSLASHETKIEGIRIDQNDVELVKQPRTNQWELRYVKRGVRALPSGMKRSAFRTLNLYQHGLKLSRTGSITGSLQGIRQLLLEASSERRIELKGVEALLRKGLGQPSAMSSEKSEGTLSDLSGGWDERDNDDSSSSFYIGEGGSIDQKGLAFHDYFRSVTVSRIERLDQKIDGSNNSHAQKANIRRRARLHGRISRDLPLIERCLQQGFRLDDWGGWGNREHQSSSKSGVSQFEWSQWSRVLENGEVETFRLQHMGTVSTASMKCETAKIGSLESIDQFSEVAPIQRLNEGEKGHWDFRGQTSPDWKYLRSQVEEIVAYVKQNVGGDNKLVSILLGFIVDEAGNIKLPPDGYDEASMGFQASGLPDTFVFALSSLIFLTASDLLLQMGALEDDPEKKRETCSFLAMCLGCQAGFVKYASLYVTDTVSMSQAASEVLGEIVDIAGYGLNIGLGTGALLTLVNSLNDMFDQDQLPHERNRWKPALGSAFLVGGNAMAIAGHASEMVAETLAEATLEAIGIPLGIEPFSMIVGAVMVVVHLFEEMQLAEYEEESMRDKNKKLSTSHMFNNLIRKQLEDHSVILDLMDRFEDCREKGENPKELLKEILKGSYSGEIYKHEFKTSVGAVGDSCRKGEYGKAFSKFITRNRTYDQAVLRLLFSDEKRSQNIHFSDDIRVFSKQNTKMLKEMAVKKYETREAFIDAILNLEVQGKRVFQKREIQEGGFPERVEQDDAVELSTAGVLNLTAVSSVVNDADRASISSRHSSEESKACEIVSVGTRFASIYPYRLYPYEAELLNNIINEFDTLKAKLHNQEGTIKAMRQLGHDHASTITSIQRTIKQQKTNSKWLGFVQGAKGALHPIKAIRSAHQRVLQLKDNCMRSFRNRFYVKGVMEAAALPVSCLASYLFRPMVHTFVIAPLMIGYNAARAGYSYLATSPCADGFDMPQLLDQLRTTGVDEYVIAVTEELIDSGQVSSSDFKKYEIHEGSALKATPAEKLKYYFSNYHDLMFGVVLRHPVIKGCLKSEARLISNGAVALADFAELESGA